MDEDEHFGAMADACLKAHAAVTDSGTPEMLFFARSFLLLIGREAAERAAGNQINLDVADAQRT